MLGMRDLFRRPWHVPSVPSGTFYVEFVTPSNITTTAFTVTWSMSENCTGQVEYGLTSSYGSTTDAETSFVYSTHVQTVSGLDPDTTYHFRTKSTNADGVTVYSDDQTVTTLADAVVPEPDTYGPRYDLYGTGALGNYPALGTIPSGTSIDWTASNVRVVPDSVWNAANLRNALHAWLNDTSAVPNGASAASPTYVVFDRSHDGEDSTQYGAGTLYTLAGNIGLEAATWTTVRRNIVFWGYNSKIKFTTPGSGRIGMGMGGYENIYILGFEIEGPGSGSMSYWDNGFNGAQEWDRALFVTSFHDMKMLDCYVHHGAQMLHLSEYGLGASGNYQHYDGWAHGPYASGFELAYCEGSDSMNQLVVVNQGWNIDIHHNYLHDVRQKVFDAEDWNRNPVDSPAFRIVNLTIRDNHFGDWSWQMPEAQGHTFSQVSFEQFLAHSGLPSRIASYENVRIENNWFDGQMRGLGNHAAEVDVLGYCASCSAATNVPIALSVPQPWGVSYAVPKLSGFVVSNNTSTYPSWITDYSGIRFNWCVFANGPGGITVQGNDFQGMGFRILSTSTINWSNNDGTYTTS